MATNAEIRARLVSLLTDVAARGRDGQGTSPLTLGGRFMRRGRYVVVTTSEAGTVIFGRVSAGLDGLATVIGPTAQVGPCAPQSLRDAWTAGSTTETNVDPADGIE